MFVYVHCTCICTYVCIYYIFVGFSYQLLHNYFVIVNDNKTAEPTSSVDVAGSLQSVTPTTYQRSWSLDSKFISML